MRVSSRSSVKASSICIESLSNPEIRVANGYQKSYNLGHFQEVLLYPGKECSVEVDPTRFQISRSCAHCRFMDGHHSCVQECPTYNER